MSGVIWPQHGQRGPYVRFCHWSGFQTSFQTAWRSTVPPRVIGAFVTLSPKSTKLLMNFSPVRTPERATSCATSGILGVCASWVSKAAAAKLRCCFPRLRFFAKRPERRQLCDPIEERLPEEAPTKLAASLSKVKEGMQTDMLTTTTWGSRLNRKNEPPHDLKGHGTNETKGHGTTNLKTIKWEHMPTCPCPPPLTLVGTLWLPPPPATPPPLCPGKFLWKTEKTDKVHEC